MKSSGIGTRRVLAHVVAVSVMAISADNGFSQQRSRIDVPVMVGAEPDYDACPSTGTVMGLDPQGDGFLSVRSGPGGRAYREIDRVFNGQHVFICHQEGPWLAVVYATQRDLDCNVSGAWPSRMPYTGPCSYGWIHTRYVGNLAG